MNLYIYFKHICPTISETVWSISVNHIPLLSLENIVVMSTVLMIWKFNFEFFFSLIPDLINIMHDKDEHTFNVMIVNNWK